MRAEQKTPEQIALEIKQQQERETTYTSLRFTYQEISLKHLFVATVAAVFTMIVLSAKTLYGTEYFFAFVGLLAFCVSVVLHLHYQFLLNDPGSIFSKNFTLFSSAKPKTLEERMMLNRKTVYNNSIPFYIGIFCLVVAGLWWLTDTRGNKAQQSSSSLQKNKTDGSVTIDLLQINDVYEIAALDNGKIGGMARVATLKKQLLQQNENTMLLMAGDFLSPSVFNSVKNIAGNNVAGAQMVAAMNAAGVDLVTFGNHEFDVSYDVLQQRVNESGFQWVSSNVYHKTDKGKALFQKNNVDIPQYFIKTFTNADGIAFNIGFLGLTVPENKGASEFVQYDSFLVSAKKMYKLLAAKCDAVIAITHLEVKEDSMLAAAIPQLTAIIGGHEHDMRFEKVGNVYITKAHSNAKSAFHLQLLLHRHHNAVTATLLPYLIPVDTSVKEDYLTRTFVERWMDNAMSYFKTSGFSPDSIICKSFTAKLDGRDAEIRSCETNLTRLITDAMLNACGNCDMAILNSGSVRVDDVIIPPVTQYSILRALPYGGKTDIAVMKGSFIKTLLDSAAKLKSEGAYLQYSFAGKLIKALLNDSVNYKVAIGHYIITGQQNKLKYVKPNAAGIVSIDSTVADKNDKMKDVRKAVIDYLGNNCGKDILKKYY